MDLGSAEGWSDHDDDGLNMIGDPGLAGDFGPMGETRHACDGGLIGYDELLVMLDSLVMSMVQNRPANQQAIATQSYFKPPALKYTQSSATSSHGTDPERARYLLIGDV